MGIKSYSSGIKTSKAFANEPADRTRFGRSNYQYQKTKQEYYGPKVSKRKACDGRQSRRKNCTASRRKGKQ